MQEQFNEKELFFVYGTLMSMYGNNRLLVDETLVDKAITVNDYQMFASGIPYVLKEINKYPIHGEVWEVKKESIRSLDGLEGHPNFYRREKIQVTLKSTGEIVEAWIYFINTSNPEEFALNRNVSELIKGDYNEYRSSSSY